MDALLRDRPEQADPRLYAAVCRRVVALLHPFYRAHRDLLWAVRAAYPIALQASAGEGARTAPARRAPLALTRSRAAADAASALTRATAAVDRMAGALRVATPLRTDLVLADAGSAAGDAQRATEPATASHRPCPLLSLGEPTDDAASSGAEREAALPRGAPPGSWHVAPAGGGVNELELPYVTKMAVLAAVLSARIPADQDDRLFTATQTGVRRKRRRGHKQVRGTVARARGAR